MTEHDAINVIKELKTTVARLEERLLFADAENKWLREQLLLNRHRLFGPKSEKTTPEELELLFNEVEATADPSVPEPDVETITYKRRKTRGGRDPQLDNLETEEILYSLPEEEQICPGCGGHLHEMGTDVREEIKIVPVHGVLVKHIRCKYACRHCQKDECSTPILIAPAPDHAFPRSPASPSAVAYIMEQKYAVGVPLYRQEKQLAHLGISLSRQTMANWVIAGAVWLQNIYDRMKHHLLKRDNLKADESKVQVLHEEGRAAETQSFFWLFRTGRDGPPIVLFLYAPTRARINAADFLEGFCGFLQTDGYVGYENLPGIRLVGCWAHARRKFTDALAILPEPVRSKGHTSAHVGLKFCNDLFKTEREIIDYAPEERRAARLERSKPVLDAFRAWLDTEASNVLPQSLVGTAVTYCRNQWEKLVTFLEDGRLDLDNNSSERSIKSFVIGRKNWLFANTVKGAEASAVIYSIVVTAQESGLNPLAYLTYLLEQLPNATTSALDDFLPWSDKLPANIHAPRKPSA
jgi:transposase